MITLGGIQFEAFELPETMPSGGAQALVVHKVIGGKRVLDAMGPDDAAIEWSGRFMGETAEMRAFQLDLLRRSGREVELSYGLRAYRCVVSQFVAQMERPYLFPYTITVEIVEDLSAGDGGKESADLERQIAENIAMAEQAAAGRDAMLRSISMASTAFRAAMGDPAARRGLASAAFGMASQAIGGAVMRATGQAAAANAAIAVVGGVGGIVAGGDPKAMALQFLGATTSVELAHAAGLAASSMKRAQTGVQSMPSA